VVAGAISCCPGDRGRALRIRSIQWLCVATGAAHTCTAAVVRSCRRSRIDVRRTCPRISAPADIRRTTIAGASLSFTRNCLVTRRNYYLSYPSPSSGSWLCPSDRDHPTRGRRCAYRLPSVDDWCRRSCQSRLRSAIHVRRTGARIGVGRDVGRTSDRRASLSRTITVWSHDELLPELSVAVQWIVTGPTGMDPLWACYRYGLGLASRTVAIIRSSRDSRRHARITGARRVGD